MSPSWSSDAELFARARRDLFSAVIGDTLDLLGRRQQFLPPEIRPLRDDMVVIGRAMPVLEADDDANTAEVSPDGARQNPFGLMLRALDDLKPDEVYVCTGHSGAYASWGALMSMSARNRGAAGVVIDGWSRDTPGILALGFPCFSRGRYAQDQRTRGKVVDFRCTIQIGGVDIRPGDAIFGDLDGVLVIPREIEAEVIDGARVKAQGEKRVFDAIKAGMSAQEAWDRYGIF